MIRHPYTLDHVAAALHSALAGGVIQEVWTQERLTCSFCIQRDISFHLYHADLTPQVGSVVERPSMKRARSNTANVLEKIVGQRIAMVTRMEQDRIITLWLEDCQCHFELFSGGSANIVVVQDGQIIDALRDKHTRVGTPFTLRPNAPPAPFTNEAEPVGKSLARSSLLLGPFYAREVCWRCRIADDAPVNTLSQAQRENLISEANRVIVACRAATRYYVVQQNFDVIFSLIPLQCATVVEEHTSILDAIRQTIALRSKQTSFAVAQRAALTSLQAALRRIERSIAAMETDAVKANRADIYRSYANLLMSLPDGKRAGMEKIDVEVEEGTSATITLDPTKTRIENATAYYAKARNAALAAVSREKRLPELQQKQRMYTGSIERVQQATTLEELRAITGSPTMKEQSPRDEGGGRFRVFYLDDVHTLYVGKNAANNDELTMRFAKQNDWWLHARGSAGSHAVLRGVSQPKVPKEILERAAEITAYYSQARNASYVSVVYTQRKYVRKPKGANVGAVTLEREQTVMVRPRIPTEES